MGIFLKLDFWWIELKILFEKRPFSFFSIFLGLVASGEFPDEPAAEAPEELSFETPEDELFNVTLCSVLMAVTGFDELEVMLLSRKGFWFPNQDWLSWFWSSLIFIPGISVFGNKSCWWTCGSFESASLNEGNSLLVIPNLKPNEALEVDEAEWSVTIKDQGDYRVFYKQLVVCSSVNLRWLWFLFDCIGFCFLENLVWLSVCIGLYQIQNEI